MSADLRAGADLPAGLAFLTGATGFIGSRLARRLAERGWRLRCLVREGSRTAALTELGAELVRDELTDAAVLTAAMEGADLAYHLAAVYELGVVDAAEMERTNVQGTRAFLDAVARAGVPRAVYVSTTVALGPVPKGRGDETTVHTGAPRSVYERTKLEAHRLARAAQARGLPLVIACPANVYGPGDEGPNGRFIRDVLRGRLPGLPTRPSWFSYVHVDDVVDGLVRIGERGEPGATYVLSGEDASLNDFARRIAALAGRRAPLLRFPPAAIPAPGRVLDAISRATGVRFPNTREAAATAAGLRWLHSHDRATAELGWVPRGLEAGLPETVSWFLRGERPAR
ncbi:MAG: NAD-dependent epimerase/dehydratase family protein [Gemmatimonadetes bacterium]|nr:NAD-dependent epimerase/dehydratase family protein [Gemmatimonadota bacterium]